MSENDRAGSFHWICESSLCSSLEQRLVGRIVCRASLLDLWEGGSPWTSGCWTKRVCRLYLYWTVDVDIDPFYSLYSKGYYLYFRQANPSLFSSSIANAYMKYIWLLIKMKEKTMEDTIIFKSLISKTFAWMLSRLYFLCTVLTVLSHVRTIMYHLIYTFTMHYYALLYLGTDK